MYIENTQVHIRALALQYLCFSNGWIWSVSVSVGWAAKRSKIHIYIYIHIALDVVSPDSVCWYNSTSYTRNFIYKNFRVM